MNQVPEFLLQKRSEVLAIASRYGIDDIRFREFTPTPENCHCGVLKFYINQPQSWNLLTMAAELDECLKVYVSVSNGDAMDKWYADEIARRSIRL